MAAERVVDCHVHVFDPQRFPYRRSGRAVLKLSGCVKVSREPYPHRDLLPYVRAALGEFGPDRCVWGSDWPFLRMPERVDYAPVLSLLAEQVPDAGDRRRILWDTPVREFGLSVD